MECREQNDANGENVKWLRNLVPSRKVSRLSSLLELSVMGGTQDRWVLKPTIGYHLEEEQLPTLFL